MSTPAATPRVTSYFFLVDFHYMKGASDELDVLPDAIVYFYPPKEDLKKQVGIHPWRKDSTFSFFRNYSIVERSLA